MFGAIDGDQPIGFPASGKQQTVNVSKTSKCERVTVIISCCPLLLLETWFNIFLCLHACTYACTYAYQYLLN